MKLRLATAAAALALAATPAAAVVTSITLSSGGSSQIIAAPTDAQALSGNTIYAFTEQTSILPAAPRPVVLAATDFLTPGVRLPAGTRISSHFFVFAPGAAGTISGTITFNQNVIGLQRQSNVLGAQDSLQLRAPGTSYGTFAGLESLDSVTFLNNKTISFSLSSTATNKDMFSVITAVPEPASWAMFITGFGLVGLGARRRRTVAA